MELWKETTNKVYLEGESAWIVAASYAKDGVIAGSLAVSWNTTDLRWEATLPYILNECTVNVTWTFTIPGTGQIIKTDGYEIITPLLTKRELKAIWNDATDEEIVDIEQAVRYIIQAHTGQSFGKREKSVVIPGAGESALALPEHILSMTGVKTLNAVLNPLAFIVVAEGWYLKKRQHDVLSQIDDPSLYWDNVNTQDYDFPLEAPHGMGLTPNRYSHGQIIYPPRRSNGRMWRDDYPFTITGIWGYDSVPQPVKEAAALLVNDYACSEQAYRDRYLDSISAADWRLQFNAQAFINTGNVRADQLLNNYVMKRGWAVI